MFVDREIGATAPRRLHQRQVEYLLIAALLAVTVALFFVMGFFSPASAGTSQGKHRHQPGAFIEAPRQAADGHVDFNGPIMRGPISEARDRVR